MGAPYVYDISHLRVNELRYGTRFIPVLWHCFLVPNIAGIVWMNLSVTGRAGAPQATTEALSPAETGTCSLLGVPLGPTLQLNPCTYRGKAAEVSGF